MKMGFDVRAAAEDMSGFMDKAILQAAVRGGRMEKNCSENSLFWNLEELVFEVLPENKNMSATGNVGRENLIIGP
jgi:hypothetical protein